MGRGESGDLGSGELGQVGAFHGVKLRGREGSDLASGERSDLRGGECLDGLIVEEPNLGRRECGELRRGQSTDVGGLHRIQLR